MIIKFFFSGIITSFIFPPFFFFPLGFISISYFFYLVIYCPSGKKNFIKNFLYGSIYGLGLNIILLHWIKEPFYIDESTRHLSSLSYFIVIYVSIYFGLVVMITSFFNNRFLKFLLLPALIVLFEFLRHNFLYGVMAQPRFNTFY